MERAFPILETTFTRIHQGMIGAVLVHGELPIRTISMGSGFREAQENRKRLPEGGSWEPQNRFLKGAILSRETSILVCGLDLAKARFKNLHIIYSQSVPYEDIHTTYINTDI